MDDFCEIQDKKYENKEYYFENVNSSKLCCLYSKSYLNINKVNQSLNFIKLCLIIIFLIYFFIIYITPFNI
jgi:hypothetical protein